MRSACSSALTLGACLLVLASGCSTHDDAASLKTGAPRAAALDSLLLPADKLARIKAALPKVRYERVQQALESPDTLWYDHDVMKPSYQKSTGGRGFWGAQANANWFAGIPNQISSIAAEGRRFVDPEKGTWRFPFSTTFGTDDSTNIKVVNFLSLPRDAGRLLPVVISIVEKPDVEAGMRTWNWIYPNQTMVGEVIFIKDGGELLPSEVRVRTRWAAGWAANVYRPFPRAADLSAAVKTKRADWQSNGALAKLVAALDDPSTLTPKKLAAPTLKDTFDQDGWLDVLPDFGDAALVRELLTTTPFSSSYATAWKESSAGKAYAASTTSALSIVPSNYAAGVLEVSDTSCMRCHKESGRLIDNWTSSLVLYGEIWGKDAIFTFQPFDEKYYPQLALEGVEDNRHMNPTLQSAGVIAKFDASQHSGPYYQRQGQ